MSGYLVEHDPDRDLYRWCCLHCASGTGLARTWSAAVSGATVHIQAGHLAGSEPRRARSRSARDGALAVLLIVATVGGCIAAWHYGPDITTWLTGLWGAR